MKPLKELLLRTMVNGANLLREIAEARAKGSDFTVRKEDVESTVNKYHPQELNLEVTEIIQRSNDAKSFRFKSINGKLPVFEAGQYINIFVEIDNVRTSRPYSISSSPNNREYFEITIAKIKAGFVSDYFLDKVKVGDRFIANGPAGVFRYNPIFHKRKAIYLAGGSGITPFMSMIFDAIEKKIDREIYLIYGARCEELAIFHRELTEIASKNSNIKYTLVVSEDDSYNGRKGFIDEELIKELIPEYQDGTFYLCGPPIMTDFCTEELNKLNVIKRTIRREMFGGRQDIWLEPGWPKEIIGEEVFKIKVGNKEIPAISKESILTALERSEIRMNVCCRSGECSLCRVALVSGKVFMPRGVLLRLADEKFGYIHSCKSYPIGDLEIRI